jgi:hypothetical protein
MRHGTIRLRIRLNPLERLIGHSSRRPVQPFISMNFRAAVAIAPRILMV